MKKELKIFAELTNYCNFSCIYCFASPCKKNATTLSFDKYKKIIDDLSTLDNWEFSVQLTGGETLSVDGFCEYGKYAKGRATKIMIGSNGSLIQALKKEELKDIKDVFDEVSISFDTTDPVLFKRLTGYPIEPVLEEIDILIKNQINIKLTPFVTKYNIDCEFYKTHYSA